MQPLAFLMASLLPPDFSSIGSTGFARNGTGVSTNGFDPFVQCGAQISAKAINLRGIFGRKQLTEQGLDRIFHWIGSSNSTHGNAYCSLSNNAVHYLEVCRKPTVTRIAFQVTAKVTCGKNAHYAKEDGRF